MPIFSLGGGVQNNDMRHRIISPEDNRYRIWSFFLTILSLYTCFVSLVQWTFITPQTRLFLILDIIICFLYIFDIFATFGVAYIDSNTFVTVDNPWRIAKHYFKTKRIFFDVMMAFPFEFIMMQFHAPSWYYRVFSSFRLVRILRFSRFLTLISWLEDSDKTNFTWMRSIKISSVCVFFIHYGACVFYYIATFNDNPKGTWIGLQRPMFLREGFAERYVDSIYWSIVTFTTVGYGDWHAVTLAEKIFTIFYLFHNLIAGAYVIGYLTNWISPSMGRKEEYKTRRDRASRFCERNGISGPLRNMIFAHLRSEHSTSLEALQDDHFLESLPRGIKSRTVHYLLYDNVKDSYLFVGVSPAILFQLVQAVKVAVYPALQVILHQNERPTCFYIVISGSVELIFLKDGVETIQIVEAGGVFGESCVLINMPQLFTVKTMEESQIGKMDRKELFDIVRAKAEEGSKIMNNVIWSLGELNDGDTKKEVLIEIEKKMATGRIDFPVSLGFALDKRNNLLFRRLMNDNPDPNAVDMVGRTALHIVAWHGDHDKVQLLIDIGANPNLRDSKGNVSLWIAMLRGHQLVINRLTTFGATLHEGNVGKYVCEAVEENNMTLFEAIQACGVDVVRVQDDQTGSTALHVVVYKNHIQFVRYLLDRDASIDQVDNDNVTPVHIANRHNHTQIQEIFGNMRAANIQEEEHEHEHEIQGEGQDD